MFAFASARYFNSSGLRVIRKIIHMEEKEIKTSGVLAGNSGLSSVAKSAAPLSTAAAAIQTAQDHLTCSAPPVLMARTPVSVDVERVSQLSLSNSTRRHDSPEFLCNVFSVLAKHGVSSELVSSAVSNVSVTLPMGAALCEDRLDKLQAELETLEVGFIYTHAVQVRLSSTVLLHEALSARVFAIFAEHDVSTQCMAIHVEQESDTVSLAVVVPECELDFVLQQLHANLSSF